MSALARPRHDARTSLACALLATLAALAAFATLAACLPRAAHAQLWSSPVTCSDCIFDYYYVDQGFARDWNCGNSSYSDHSGTDYSLRDGNFAIDDDNEVVAMAPGVVVSTQDGYYDRCTRCGGSNCGTGFGNGFANQVIINHGVHRVIYGHMKQGSVAVKQGDTVACGQVLGFIASSGCSTGAHLHIEPSIAAEFGVAPYRYIDPYAGDCSDTPSSLWSDQGGYRVLPGTACDGEPPVPACPSETYPIWTCLPDGSARRRCTEGVVADEACVWGCGVMPPGTDDVCELPPDADGDGSRADVDCDDANDTRHPGALERCGDAIDQDCSGADLACPSDAPGAIAGSGLAGAGGVGGASGQSGAPATAGQLEPGTAGGAALPTGSPGQPVTQAGMGGFGPVASLPAPGAGARARAEAEAGCNVTRVGQPGFEPIWPGLGLGVLALLRLRRRLRSWSSGA